MRDNLSLRSGLSRERDGNITVRYNLVVISFHLKMIPNEITLQNLNAIDVLEGIASKAGTVAYVWGGFVVDIYTGKIERDHDDVEQLVLNLYKYMPRLEKLFIENGCETEILENGDLRVKKDGAKMHMGHLMIENKARWFHNGNKGYIEFPISWLNPEVLEFHKIKLRAVCPEFQYVLKKNPILMNHQWKPREKDKFDIEKLEEILRERGTELRGLDREMESIG